MIIGTQYKSEINDVLIVVVGNVIACRHMYILSL